MALCQSAIPSATRRAYWEWGRRRAALPTYHDLDALTGTWGEDEAAACLQAIADFEQGDPSLWQRGASSLIQNAYATFKWDLPDAVDVLAHALRIETKNSVLGELCSSFAVGMRDQVLNFDGMLSDKSWERTQREPIEFRTISHEH